MIEVKDLCYSYDKSDKQTDRALNNINLTIYDNEWLAILGHNGSGKSTLSKLLVGLLEVPIKGTISYDGILLNEENIKQIRQKVGIVFQNPDNQFVGVNVKYDVAFGLENRNTPRPLMHELVEKWTKEVGMYDYLDREPNTLSGGQKQRVAIAGILALNCDVIILDEATSMLDPEGVIDITNLIVTLKNTYHKTIITITHDLDIAKLADRVIVLKEGSIIGEGKPDEIFKQRELLQSSNLDMPFRLRFYTEVLNDPILSKNKRLEDALWQYHFMK